MDDIDTGDIILYKPRRERHMVACVHDNAVWLVGPFQNSVRRIDCQLITKATEKQRLDQLRMMAQSTADSHRPKCARERIANMMTHTYS